MGIIVSGLFGALILGYYLRFSPPTGGSVASSQHVGESRPDERTSGFIPGGIRLTGNVNQADLPSEVVLREIPLSETSPQAMDEIHVRSRTLRLSEAVNLQPPAPGHEDSALREFVFDLFDDVRLTGRVERLERHHDDRAVYYGSLTNVRGGDFILAYNEGHVAATFHTPGMGSFQLRPRGDGTVAALEVDLSRLPPCNARPHTAAAGTLPELAAADIRAKAAIHGYYAATPPVEGGTYGGAGQQGGDGEGLVFTTIDVLIVSTNNAVSAAGGAAAMDAIIDMTFARANSALINSEVGLRLRMVRSEAVAYNETSTNTSLDAITDGTGAFANVASWRNQSGADLVALIFNGGGGLAWIYNGNSGFGFSVNGLSGIESTFIHEIGHNLGCLHDRENNGIAVIYPYSHGWRFTPEGSGELRTIMAFAPGDRIPYFSNPDVTYMGTPTGVPIGEPMQSNNAEVMRLTKALAAAFRAENGNSPPSVVLESPSYSDPFKALDSVSLAASASDSDGTVQEVRFYRLMRDDLLNFSSSISTSLGSDVSAPYTVQETSTPAGFWTYAAVAHDDGGGIGVDTVSVAVAPHYLRTNLTKPEGKAFTEIEGINEAGRVVGYGHNGNTNATDTRAAYWENGNITLLNPLAGDTGARALAVGQDGVVYGQSISGGGNRRAVQWNHSVTPTDISTLVGGFSADRALGVDDQGRIYLGQGNNYRRYNSPGSSTTPGNNQLWEKVANTGVFATGHDFASSPTSAWRAMRWNNGSTRLAPVAGYVSSWGRATNRSGAVFGHSSPATNLWDGNTARLTFWPAGSTTPVDLGTLGANGGVAYGLNDWNDAVGTAFDPDDGGLAVIWKGQGDLIALDDLALPQVGLKREARVINNRGQIAGTGFDNLGQFIFFLDPLPGLENRYWLANHFNPAELEDDMLVDDQANPAGDGLSNLVKRAFGLDPRVAATSEDLAKLPQGTLEEDGHYHFRFRRLRAPRDIEYAPEASFSLAGDGWDESVLEHVSTTFLDDDYEEIQLRTTFPINDQAKAFIRLRLSR